jgi:aryl-alcohol dehydrogenase-like predicted oxidoreductase
MEKQVLGRTGLEASVAGLGSGGFSRLGMFSKGIEHACRIIRQAYDEGVNFFDTATRYGTEPALGKALEGIPHDSYILSAKFPYSDNGRLRPAEELEKYLDKSLKALETDHIDIYHLHGVLPQLYPAVRDRYYPELLKMKEKGKIRFTGLTELFGTDSPHEALKLALQDDLWDVVMLGYNIINPSAAKTVLPLTQAKNVGTLCMFAVRNSLSKPEELKLDVRKMIAAHQVDQALVKEEHTLDFLIDNGYSKTIMEAAYRFCCHTAGIDVTLTGTGSAEHLAENIRSIQMPPLPQEALERLEAMFGRVDCVSGEQEMPHL